MMYSENIHFTTRGVGLTDKHGRPLSISQAAAKAVSRIANWYFDWELMVLHFISDHVALASVRHWFLRLSGIRIGRGATVHMSCRFFSPRGIEVGEDTKIGFGTFLDGRAKLRIGSHVDVASEVMIYNSEHDLEAEDFTARQEEVVIGDYVFIGPRVIIMPGVKIGRGAVVAGGAVVTKNVPDFTIVGGVPAEVIGQRRLRHPTYRLGRSRLFQ